MSPSAASRDLAPSVPSPAVAGADRTVLRTLQVLTFGLPLLLSGHHAWAMAAAAPAMLLLLALTLRERQRSGAGAHAPGMAALVGFVALAVATTVPLPPAVLRLVAPATARLYSAMLPGWPGNGGWSVWRTLAVDPYGVWVELSRLSIGLGVFVVVVAYPWRVTREGEDAPTPVFSRLLITLVAAGTLLAALGLLSEVAGNGRVLWITGSPTPSGRVSGPFVSPNHFAAWLEMVIPVTLACLVSLIASVSGPLLQSTDVVRGTGTRLWRARISAIALHQRRLWTTLLASSAVLLMGLAHVSSSGSRAGTAALLLGLGVAAAGIAPSLQPQGTHAGGKRWLPAAVSLGLLLASGASVAFWSTADVEKQAVSTAGENDVSLASRLAVSTQGQAILRGYPLFGTGLGSWRHAFRPYQAPPVEGRTWDHAYNDYVELAAETGVFGSVLALLFAIGVGHALRRRTGEHPAEPPPGVERSEWRAAFANRALIRWGLAGGVAAILARSLVDSGLRLPANLPMLMLLLGLLALGARSQPAGRDRALRLMLVLLTVAAVPQVANALRMLAGASPLSPRDCLERANLLLADQRDGACEGAVTLIRRALDRSPADLEAHEALASALGPGLEGEAALRRALALSPWSSEIRDRLAFRLLQRGERVAGAAELEESMFRFPYLASHAYFGPGNELEPHDTEHLAAALGEGDTPKARLAALGTELAEAIEHGLTRALRESRRGAQRAAISADLVTLLEARGRWGEAAATLRAEAERNPGGGSRFARAARDYLKARDDAAAEQMLMAALRRAPEQGELYRTLAVEIYAARGDFPRAESVLRAARRNAFDMRPVYEGVTEVLVRREESIRAESSVRPVPEPRAMGEIVP